MQSIENKEPIRAQSARRHKQGKKKKKGGGRNLKYFENKLFVSRVTTQ